MTYVKTTQRSHPPASTVPGFAYRGSTCDCRKSNPRKAPEAPLFLGDSRKKREAGALTSESDLLLILRALNQNLGLFQLDYREPPGSAVMCLL